MFFKDCFTKYSQLEFSEDFILKILSARVISYPCSFVASENTAFIQYDGREGGQHGSTVTSQLEGLGSVPPWPTRSVQFAGSPCGCVVFLLVLQFPGTPVSCLPLHTGHLCPPSGPMTAGIDPSLRPSSGYSFQEQMNLFVIHWCI